MCMSVIEHEIKRYQQLTDDMEVKRKNGEFTYITVISMTLVCAASSQVQLCQLRGQERLREDQEEVPDCYSKAGDAAQASPVSPAEPLGGHYR